MVRFVDENPRLQVAVLAQHWSVLHRDDDLAGRKADLSPGLEGRCAHRAQRSLEVLRQSLEQTIDFFEQHGVHVVLMGEIPLFDRDP